MRFELLIHGVPAGHDCWGIAQERNYLDTFYKSNVDDDVYMQVCSRTLDTDYYYYHYLVYKTPRSPKNNIIASDDRPNSYFGMTLRTDEFLTDIIGVYQLLDFIFNSYIKGVLLKQEGDRYKYTISRFIERDFIFKEIETFIGERLIAWGKYAPQDKFRKQLTLPRSSAKMKRVNLYDYSNSELVGFVEKDGALFISPYIDTFKLAVEKQHYQILADTQKREYEEVVASYKKDNDHIQIENARLKNELVARNKDLNKLEKEIRIQRKHTYNRVIEDNRNHYQENKEEPAVELPTGLRSDSFAKLTSVLSRFFPILQAILTILTFVCVVIIFFRGSADQKVHAHTESRLEEVSLAKYSKTENEPEPSSKSNSEEPLIDIEGYTGDAPLEKEKTYIARLKDYEDNDNGIWKLTGGTIRKNAKNEMKFIPKKPKIVIEYVVNDTTTVAKRELDAK